MEPETNPLPPKTWEEGETACQRSCDPGRALELSWVEGSGVGAAGGGLWRTRPKHPADKDHQWSWPSLLRPHRGTRSPARSPVSAGRYGLDGAAGGVGRRDSDQGAAGVLRCQWCLHTGSLLPRARPPLHIPLSRSCLTKDSGPGQWGTMGDKREELGRGGRGGGPWSQLPHILCTRVGARTSPFPSEWGGEISSTPPKSIAPQDSASSPTRGALTGMWGGENGIGSTARLVI